MFARTLLLIAASIVAIGVLSAVIAQESATATTEVRINALRLDDGRTEFALQQRGLGEVWSDRLLPRGRYFPARAIVGRWLNSTPLILSDGPAVRISARLMDDGRIEFALQQRNEGGQWEERRLPRSRMFPVNARIGRWLSSSVLTLDTPTGSSSATENQVQFGVESEGVFAGGEWRHVEGGGRGWREVVAVVAPAFEEWERVMGGGGGWFSMLSVLGESTDRVYDTGVMNLGCAHDSGVAFVSVSARRWSVTGIQSRLSSGAETSGSIYLGDERVGGALSWSTSAHHAAPRRGALSTEFIRRAMTEGNHVRFVLPRRGDDEIVVTFDLGVAFESPLQHLLEECLSSAPPKAQFRVESEGIYAGGLWAHYLGGGNTAWLSVVTVLGDRSGWSNGTGVLELRCNHSRGNGEASARVYATLSEVPPTIHWASSRVSLRRGDEVPGSFYLGDEQVRGALSWSTRSAHFEDYADYAWPGPRVGADAEFMRRAMTVGDRVDFVLPTLGEDEITVTFDLGVAFESPVQHLLEDCLD